MAARTLVAPRRAPSSRRRHGGGAGRAGGTRAGQDELELFTEGLTEAPHEPAAVVSDRPTLEDVISGVWEGLSGHAVAECLVCGGEMVPRYSAGAAVVGGRCGSCGSSLE